MAEAEEETMTQEAHYKGTEYDCLTHREGGRTPANIDAMEMTLARDPTKEQ